ncbi:MAG: choice-of-anchor B family protein [Gemmatimonadales bacterium]
MPNVPTVLLALALASPLAFAQTFAADRPPTVRMSGFGASLVILGDDIAIGRSEAGLWGATVASPRGGGVHLFRRGADGNWSEHGSIDPSDPAPGNGFGASLAAAGDLLAVGAPSTGTGAVYLFRRAGTAWRQISKITLADGAKTDGFGLVLALQPDLLLIGAPARDSGRGAVYAVRRRGTEWAAPELAGAGIEPNDRFGSALALDGNRVLIAAPGPDPVRGGGPRDRPKPGTATVYRIAGGRLIAESSLSLPATDSVVGLGTAALLAGNEAFLSAPTANRGAGVVYRFGRQADGSWRAADRLAANLMPPAPGPLPRPAPGSQGMGMAIIKAGGQLLVGAPSFSSSRDGAVIAFGTIGAGWTETQRITAESGARSGFGLALAGSAAMAVIGAPTGDFGQGLAFVLGQEAGQWKVLGRLIDTPLLLPTITGGTEKTCQAGTAEGYSCQDVDLQSFLPIHAIGGKRGVELNDIWGWTDPLTGKEWALVGRVDGTSFVDVSDPVNPRYAANLPMTPGSWPNSWRDIKVYRNHAYIVADQVGQHGMQVFDLTRLREFNAAPVTVAADTVYDKIASAHNIVINEETGFAYTVGNSGGGETCGGGLHIIDIREPRVPRFAGCWADRSTGITRTGYTHDAMCVTYHGPDTRYSNREICFNASETAVGIADLSDKSGPKRIAVAEYPNTAYAHQGWLSNDHRYFFLDDEGDETSGLVAKTRTLIWDVSKLDEPVLVKEFLGTTSASDHNLYIRGRYMYQSNYLAGLRVVDIADPTNPREVGYLDTVPWGENAPGFEGSWSNYPYFKSGTIVVSSIGQGLFVVKHRAMAPVP